MKFFFFFAGMENVENWIFYTYVDPNWTFDLCITLIIPIFHLHSMISNQTNLYEIRPKTMETWCKKSIQISNDKIEWYFQHQTGKIPTMQTGSGYEIYLHFLKWKIEISNRNRNEKKFPLQSPTVHKTWCEIT